MAPSRAVSATPASSSTVVDVPRRRATDSAYTIASAPADPAKLPTGIDETPSVVRSRCSVMTRSAPSVAPADTPNVSGDASGLRSSAWNTTPATANAPPTRAAARTLGRRATKNTCASTLSANGIDRSKTRARRIGVLPTRGARTMTTSVPAAKAAIVSNMRVASRDRVSVTATSARATNWHHRQMAGASVHRYVCVDVVERPNALSREYLLDGSLRDDTPVADQH